MDNERLRASAQTSYSPFHQGFFCPDISIAHTPELSDSGHQHSATAADFCNIRAVRGSIKAPGDEGGGDTTRAGFQSSLSTSSPTATADYSP